MQHGFLKKKALEGATSVIVKSLRIFVFSSVHSPGAVHPEAGDAHHGPAAAELAGEQRAATVAVTRVTCPVTRTQLRRAWVDRG